MIVAANDTMYATAMEVRGKRVQKGRPNGSDLAMWGDREVFMQGIIRVIRDVDQSVFDVN